MPSTPYDSDAPRERSVGEHIFIWIAWALAAAFWGASLTTVVEIFRTAGQASSAISAPGAPGGSAYLVLVVGAFLIIALALAYASIRSAMGRPDAALYSTIERQRRDDMTSRAPDRRRQERDFR